MPEKRRRAMEAARLPQPIPASIATTSVMAPDLVPFVGSGQMIGLVAGMSGAAQFEQLVGVVGGGSQGMDAQSFAHLLIIAAIILANIAYLTSPEFRRRRRR